MRAGTVGSDVQICLRPPTPKRQHVMVMEDLSANLVMRWRAGDQQAAEALFQRYAERLLALARSRLSARMARHVDAEDVVQSAYRSFFVGARDGRYLLRRSGDLWRLLVAITVHKLQHQVERHMAKKRTGAQEWKSGGAVDTRSESDSLGLPAPALAREPTPADAAALADTLEHVLGGLDVRQRLIVELRLQGFSTDEVSDATQRSERTVRRVLERVKRALERIREAESGS